MAFNRVVERLQTHRRPLVFRGDEMKKINKCKVSPISFFDSGKGGHSVLCPKPSNKIPKFECEGPTRMVSSIFLGPRYYRRNNKHFHKVYGTDQRVAVIYGYDNTAKITIL